MEIYEQGHRCGVGCTLGGVPVHPLDVFLYYRLRVTCKQVHPTFPEEPPGFPALEYTLTAPSTKRLITRLYAIIQDKAQVW